MEITEIVKLANRIHADVTRLRSRTRLAVMFVDLVGSTEYKNTHPLEEDWLPRLATFLLGVTRIVETHGRVVKYIGDEVMAVFEGDHACLNAEQAAERVLEFCEKMQGHEMRVKIALDIGEVVLLDFSESKPKATSKVRSKALHAADPNGIIVDRCARIMSKATPGAVLCSTTFRAAARSPDRWRPVGAFTAKGLKDPVEVFLLETRGAPKLVVEDEALTQAQCMVELKRVRDQLAAYKELHSRSDEP